MNINLIYQNNSFNFDLRKDISIKYIEDLASKLINKDKSSFELLYKDNILSENKNILLKDIVETETNIPININTKYPNKQLPKSKKIFPKIKLFNRKNIGENNDLKNNLLLNETEISQSLSENSIKLLQNLSKYKLKNKNKIEYTTQNKVFEEIYNTKDNEIINLMKNLSQKIKEYDDVLYKRNKNNYNKSNNNELITFEKNIIDFKDKQIQYLQKLIKFFEPTKKKDFSSQSINIDLDELYKELFSYDNKDYLVQNKKNNDIADIGIDKKEKKMLSPIREKDYANSNKELPLIVNKSINKGNKMYFSEKRLNIDNNKEEKKDKSLFFSHDNNKIKLRNNNNIKEKIFQSIDNQEDKINKTKDNNKFNINKRYLKKNSIGNTTKANTNQSENSISSKPQEKKNKISTILPKKLNNKENNNQNSNSTRNKKSFELFKRVNTIQNINYNKKKVSTLFEISESHPKEKESESERYKDNLSEIKSSEDNNSNDDSKGDNFLSDNEDIKKLKNNLNKKKKAINYSLIKNSKIGYLIKAKNRKVSQRIKKLGNNADDFLI